MRLKSFTAKTMSEAMQMVRETLGEDAIILATREENGGRSVSVSAAIEDDRAPASPRSVIGQSPLVNPALHSPLALPFAPSLAFEIGDRDEPAQADDWLQYDDEHQFDDRVIEQTVDAVLRHGVAEDIVDEIIHCVELLSVEEPAIAMIGAFEQLFAFHPLPIARYKKPMMFVGAPGSGKTLITAKQAARGVMEGLKVAVITTDMMRAGANEQLKSFTSLMEIELQAARSTVELKKLIAENADKDQILIDTAGINPFAPHDIALLAKLIACAPIEPVLVMPAGGDIEDCADTARVFAGLGARRCVITRLDIARRMGGVLACAYYGGLALADASATAGVAEGLMPLTPRRLASYFFPTELNNQKTLRTSSSNFPSTP